MAGYYGSRRQAAPAPFQSPHPEVVDRTWPDSFMTPLCGWPYAPATWAPCNAGLGYYASQRYSKRAAWRARSPSFGRRCQNGVPVARTAVEAATGHRPEWADIYPSLLPAIELLRGGRLRLELAGNAHATRVLYTSWLFRASVPLRPSAISVPLRHLFLYFFALPIWVPLPLHRTSASVLPPLRLC